MADESFTPRTLIQGILENNPDMVDQTVRVTRQQTKLLNASLSQTRSGRKPKSRKRRSSDTDVKSAVKKGKANSSRLSASSTTERTPRTLIAGFLGTQDSENTLRIAPRTGPEARGHSTQRKPRRKSLLKEATTRRLRQSVGEGESEPTPRTLITGFIHHGDEETPVLPVREVKQKRKSSVHRAYDSSIIETSRAPNTSRLNKTSASDLEESFMGAYSQFSQQSQPTRMQTRYQREHIALSPKHSQNLKRSKLLENIGESETRSGQTSGRPVANIITTAQVHTVTMGTSSEVDKEGDTATEEQQESFEKHKDLEQEAEDDQRSREVEGEEEREDDEGEKELRNVEEKSDDEQQKPEDGEDQQTDLDMSEDYTNTNSLSGHGSQIEQIVTVQDGSDGMDDAEPLVAYGNNNRTLPEPRQIPNQISAEESTSSGQHIYEATFVEDLVIERQRAQKDLGQITNVSGIRDSSRRTTNDDNNDQQENEQRETEEKGTENNEEPGVAERREFEREEEENLSFVAPSEDSEDETDSREGLPKFNETFTSSKTGHGRMQQTRMESFYSTRQTQEPADLHTPDVPQSAVRRTGYVFASLSPNKANKTHPLVPVPPRKVHAPPVPKTSVGKKKSPFPCLPAVNTSSIFKHFTDLRVSKEAMVEVERVADDFWKNVVGDMAAYAQHANRVSADESDIALLMRRQRVTSEGMSMYTLVEKYLPLEYQMEIIDVAKSGNVIVP